MAEIGPEWSDVISSVETLVREMSEKSIEEVFRDFVDGISDAMMHSMVHAPAYYQQVGITLRRAASFQNQQSDCVPSETQISLAQSDQSLCCALSG